LCCDPRKSKEFFVDFVFSFCDFGFCDFDFQNIDFRVLIARGLPRKAHIPKKFSGSLPFSVLLGAALLHIPTLYAGHFVV
jgi:hypothetical protein